MFSPEARNYFPKSEMFQKQVNFLFLYEYILRISTNIYASKACTFRKKLGFMMPSIKIWDRFSLQPGFFFFFFFWKVVSLFNGIGNINLPCRVGNYLVGRSRMDMFDIYQTKCRLLHVLNGPYLGCNSFSQMCTRTSSNWVLESRMHLNPGLGGHERFSLFYQCRR